MCKQRVLNTLQTISVLDMDRPCVLGHSKRCEQLGVCAVQTQCAGHCKEEPEDRALYSVKEALYGESTNAAFLSILTDSCQKQKRMLLNCGHSEQYLVITASLWSLNGQHCKCESGEPISHCILYTYTELVNIHQYTNLYKA